MLCDQCHFNFFQYNLNSITFHPMKRETVNKPLNWKRKNIAQIFVTFHLIVESLANRIRLAQPSRHVFTQNGAPPHSAMVVCNWPHRHLNGWWLGRAGPHEWPAGSPDLTPSDTFLWGYAKEEVYNSNPPNLRSTQKFNKYCKFTHPEGAYPLETRIW